MKLRTLALLFFCLFAPAAVKADPLYFGNARLIIQTATPPTGIDLFQNQGITLVNSQDNPVAVLLVDITGDLSPGGSDTLRWTVTATNEQGTFSIINPNPASMNLPIPSSGLFPPFTFGLAFAVPSSYSGTLLSLNFDLLNSNPDFIIPSGPNAGQRVNSFTYSFTVVQAVPEPTTLVLLGTGFAGIVFKAGRRRH